jgi:hypothetical protein
MTVLQGFKMEISSAKVSRPCANFSSKSSDDHTTTAGDYRHPCGVVACESGREKLGGKEYEYTRLSIIFKGIDYWFNDYQYRPHWQLALLANRFVKAVLDKASRT